MTPFEKYTKLKEDAAGKDYDESSLQQYLHIAQVMYEEEKSYKAHRKKMMDWLNNIERCVRQSIKEK